MKGKLYELRAEVVTYYWSSTGEPPKRGAADSAIEQAASAFGLDAEVDVYDSPEMPREHSANDLIFGDHGGDFTQGVTMGEALAAMKEAREKAAFDARQEMLF